MLRKNRLRGIALIVIVYWIIKATYTLYFYDDTHAEASVYDSVSSLFNTNTNHLCKGKYAYIYVYDIPKDLLHPKQPSKNKWWDMEYILWQSMLTVDCITTDPSRAQFFFIPHASTLLYHYKDQFNKKKASLALINIVKYVINTYDYFNKTLGSDHVMPFAHDGFHSFMSKEDQALLPQEFYRNVIFIINQAEPMWFCFNVHKDIITIPFAEDPQRLWNARGFERKPWSLRKYLFYHRGQIVIDDPVYSRGVRQALYEMYKDDSDVVFSDYSSDFETYALELMEAKFCLFIIGWTAWSERMATIINAGCIPVVISDDYGFPFWQDVNWPEFTYRISQKNAIIPGYLKAFLASISEREAMAKEEAIAKIRHSLMYHVPAEPNDISYRLLEVLGRRATHYKLFSNVFSTDLNQ